MLGRNLLLLKMIVNVTVKIKNILQHWYSFRGLEQRFFLKQQTRALMEQLNILGNMLICLLAESYWRLIPLSA